MISLTSSPFKIIIGKKQVEYKARLTIRYGIKYLGILHDHNLSRKKQIEHIIDKGHKINNILKSLANTKYGGRTSSMIL